MRKSTIPLLVALAAAMPATPTLAGPTLATGAGGSFSNLQPSLALTQFIVTQGVLASESGDGGTSINTIGAVMTFAGNFSPQRGGALDGSLVSIGSNIALFSRTGITYGGDGVSTFALPDQRGRILVGAGTDSPGTQTGTRSVTLTRDQLPAHSHAVAVGSGPSGSTGAGAPFDNRQPSLAMNYLIAVNGRSAGAGSDELLPGQVRAWAGYFVPNGYMAADGRELPMGAYPDLFKVLGTTYGGDGKSTFALPDLRDRTVIGADGKSDNGPKLAATVGSDTVTLTANQLPAHSHGVTAGNPTQSTGAGKSFDNRQRSVALQYLIAMQGVFPSRDSASPESEFLGDIIMYAGDDVPEGYLPARGQLLQIAPNQALFALLGTSYGGDGQRNFALPDLRGRAVIGTGDGFDLGGVYGEDFTGLTVDQIPSHTHALADLGDAPPPAVVRTGGDPAATAVAEPATASTLVLGALALLGLRRRMRGIAAA